MGCDRIEIVRFEKTLIAHLYGAETKNFHFEKQKHKVEHKGLDSHLLSRQAWKEQVEAMSRA